VVAGARVRRFGVLALLALGACAALLLRTGESHARPTDYAADLERLDRELLALGPATTPLSVARATRHVALLQRRAGLTGSPADEARARAATREARQRLGPAPDLVLLEVDFGLRFHRLTEARAALASLPPGPGGPDIEFLRADLALQEGDDARARRHCEAALRARRDFGVLARLAHLASRAGDSAGAEVLYGQAEDELTAKEMRAFAWLQTQRGLLAFDRGRYAEAEERYARAERAYSGDWRLAKHQAELLRAQGRFDEAASRYEDAALRRGLPALEVHEHR
jgi:tetratricopeptide (TPR) repeat protein